MDMDKLTPDLTKIQVPQDDHRSNFLVNLPVEILFYILSFLSTRDKISMRYVSQKFHHISETPLLWKEFIWPDWEPRHVCSVSNILKACGEHVRRIFFPAHVEPTKILEMVHCCAKATKLSLAYGTQLHLNHLKEILLTMRHLQVLDVSASGIFIKDLFEVIGTHVKELKLRIIGRDARHTLKNIQRWAKGGNALPSTINIITQVTDYMVYKQFKFWWKSSFKMFSFKIGLYDSAKVPMNLHPSMPLIKLQFGAGSTFPFIKLSSYGILDLEEEVLLVTDYDHYGKNKHTLAIGFVDFCYKFEEGDLNFSIGNLHSVTYVNFSYAEVYSNHLEQLAVACPNLQRLNLKDVDNCLESLQGLRAIVQMCHSLQGLNLAGISVSFVESYLLFWELLSSAKKLTHLAIELCMLIPGDRDDANKQKLISMLRSCVSLQALEVNRHDWGVICIECAQEDASCAEDFLFSHFPSLLYARLTLTDCITALNYTIANCHRLQYLCFENDFTNDMPLPLPKSCHLQQVCIQAWSTDLSSPFTNDLSVHGELECVVLFVNSITISAITTLINNSPNLVLLYTVTKQPLCDEDGNRLKQKDYVGAVSKAFSCHKLFTAGSCILLRDTGKVCRDEVLGRFNTDLSSLWPSVGTMLSK